MAFGCVIASIQASGLSTASHVARQPAQTLTCLCLRQDHYFSSPHQQPSIAKTRKQRSQCLTRSVDAQRNLVSAKFFPKHQDFRITSREDEVASNWSHPAAPLAGFICHLGEGRGAACKGCRSWSLVVHSLRRKQSRVCAVSKEAEGSDGDSEIPATSDEFLRKVSSESYTSLSRQMQEKEEASFEVTDRNPWAGEEKAVYVLVKKESSLFTMKVRKDRSDVEKEFTILFPKKGRQRPQSNQDVQPPVGAEGKQTARFSMHVDTVSEGILVFEDEDEATRFCGLLETDGHQNLAVVETNASELFSLCQRSKAVAIVFREGVMPPLPDRLQRALRARKYSLDD